MNKKWFSIVAATLILVAIGWWFLANQNQQTAVDESTSSVKNFSTEYSLVPKNNKFYYATSEEVLAIFESGSGLVFLGFPECPWCQQLAPIVNEAAEKAGLDKIYYLNIKQSRADNDAVYQKILAKLADRLNKDEDGNPRIYVPDVSAVRDGEIVGHFLQETTADGEEVTPETYWTEERRQRAIEQLTEMMKNVNVSEFSKVEKDVAGGALLLDVRTPSEFAAGHAKGAVNLDSVDIQSGKSPEVSKDTKIYVYCRSGNRSAQVASILKSRGFTNVVDLGGLSDIQ